MASTIWIDAGNLKRGKWYEYAIRFALGGMVTVAAGLIADHYGPALGGLFLAFPAILPAAATLIARHEREKKAAQGLHGTRRALDAAALDTYGALLGSGGLLAFGAVGGWLLGRIDAPLALLLAALAWIVAIAAAWIIRKHPLRWTSPRRQAG